MNGNRAKEIGVPERIEDKRELVSEALESALGHNEVRTLLTQPGTVSLAGP
jgi:hypothetical protein